MVALLYKASGSRSWYDAEVDNDGETGSRMGGTMVRRLRKQQGLSLAALAKRAGVAKGTVLRADHGEDVQLGSLRRIAEGLGVEVVDLMREEEPDIEEPDRAA